LFPRARPKTCNGGKAEHSIDPPLIWYRANYKYQLAQSYTVTISIRPDYDIGSTFVELTREGGLTVFQHYAWDGPSGPTIDTRNFMRGSLVHDALYQLIREGWLGAQCRDQVDRELRRLCREDGMSAIRAWWVYMGVRFGGGPAADPANREKPALSAPAASK
jgi:hypothetical protein